MFYANGLSPPTRGIPSTSAISGASVRSIPAYAGDPGLGCGNQTPPGVYPRLRGGSGWFIESVEQPQGLSPPTRGIPARFELERMDVRSIPAYAGDPLGQRRLPASLEVYPRLRGGSISGANEEQEQWGLSPPTRGIRGKGSANDIAVRSIPAYAGDPPRRVHSVNTIAVYPRLRGGSLFVNGEPVDIPGLSPPTRGIPSREPCFISTDRSIPAYAGDPLSFWFWASYRTVYPRLRGGSALLTARRLLVAGLSPPTRGIRRRRASANVR